MLLTSWLKARRELKTETLILCKIIDFDLYTQVQDLFTDLADGRMLLKLLEVISGEKLGLLQPRIYSLFLQNFFNFSL
jgi:hypothetical protein